MPKSAQNDSYHPFPVLIADVGGTNARFSIVVDAYAEPKAFKTVKAADYATLDDAIEDNVLAQTSLMPKSAVLAVAGPIDGDEIDLTNNHWIVRPQAMMERFGILETVVLNDYEAQALALTALEGDDLEPIGTGTQEPVANRVVIGPGTGLGVAGLVHAANTWIPVAGEGGHVDLGPRTERDHAIFPHLQTVDGRISGEQILCGRGMVNLYNAVAAVSDSDLRLTTPEEVTAAAMGGDNPVADETISLFCEYLGRVAGDLALVFMARGGVYLSGGITQKIRPVFDNERFRAAFDDKAPHSDLMRAMPCYAVMHAMAPMLGLAAYARTPQRFGVSLEGRCWKK